MKPFYLCAGMSRSGSTWLYNVVRLLCERYHNKVYSCYVSEYQGDWRENFNAAVIKVHDKTPKLIEGSTIVTSRRDLRDIAASLILKGWANEHNVVGILDWAVKCHGFYADKTVFELDYEQLLEFPHLMVHEIGKAIGLNRNDLIPDLGKARDIVAAVSRLSNTSGLTYDRTNLLHRNHSTRRAVGYYREVLSPTLIHNIETTFKDWLERWGYLGCTHS